MPTAASTRRSPLPPLEKEKIADEAASWAAEALAPYEDPVEVVRRASWLIATEAAALEEARPLRDAAALSIREYGPDAVEPIPRKVRNVGLDAATGISRPRLQKLRDRHDPNTPVPLVPQAGERLPDLAAAAATHEQRQNAARRWRDAAVYRLLEGGWTNIDIAPLTGLNPSRIAHLRKEWGGGAADLEEELAALRTPGPPPARTATRAHPSPEDDEPPRTLTPRVEPFALPAEAQEGALNLLRRLIGQPLRTPSGRTNTVTAVSNSTVTVATERSPAGQLVPVAEVQNALDELTTTGHVVIHPDQIGHRSAFIGAVLRTLPHTRLDGSPPTLRLLPAADRTRPPTVATTDDQLTATFEGDLSLEGRGTTRGEQAAIRQRLFANATTARCALCGETLPVRFLWAAHIKKRAHCTDEERRDIANVAMPACVLGCDALYETGYLTVDPDGHVAASAGDHPPALAHRLANLDGRACAAFTPHSAGYFAWHRANIFRG